MFRRIEAYAICIIMSVSILSGPVTVRASYGITKAEAQSQVDKCQTDVDNVRKNIESLNNELQEKQKAVTDKKEAYSEAQAVIASGSYGYFQNKNATDAMAILKDENVNEKYISREAPDNFISYTKIGDENDATSLENMKRSLAWIKVCNKIRREDEHALNPCTVNDVVMAMAQTDANYSSSNSHAQYYHTSENLAWGYIIEYTGSSIGPYVGWYNKEKEYYKANVDSIPGASGMSAYELYTKQTSFYMQVGHYLNIITEGTPVTGYAINSGTRTQAQEFAQTYYVGNGVTIDEYEEDFMKYYNDVTSKAAAAKSALDAANNDLQATQSEIDTANNALVAAKSALEQAKLNLEKAGEVEYTSDNTNQSGIVTIPNTVKGEDGQTYTVTKIADNTFSNNKKITNITMGSNITEIGANSFKNCTKLKKVTISGGVVSVGKNAFANCKKLKTIKINGNSLKKVGKNAFKGIKGNATITVLAKDKKTYKKVVKMLKKAGAKKCKYKYKKKK